MKRLAILALVSSLTIGAALAPAGAQSPDPASPDPASPDPASPDPASPDPASPDPASPDPATAGATNADAPAVDALQADLEKRALTRAWAERTPVGEAAKEVVESDINWIEMKTALALSARRDVAAQQTVTRAVARPPGMRAAAAESFKNVVVKEVNVTQLPVLAPEGARIAQTLKVYSLGNSYSATAEVEDGVSMRMSGARKKLVVGDRAAALSRIRTMRAQEKSLASLETPYVITRSESSTDLSFSKFGAGYVLALMCDDPADARCAADDFIVKLASNIVLLNQEAGGQ